MAFMTEDVIERARSKQDIFGLAMSTLVPAALSTVVELNVPDILASAHPKGSALSARDILDQVPERSENSSARNLERIMRLLACKGVFTEEVDERGVERRFGLTSLSNVLRKCEMGDTMRNWVIMAGGKENDFQAMLHMDNAVLTSEVPFEKSHDGKHQFEYMRANPKFLGCFQRGMTDMSNLVLPLIFEKYDGFKEVRRMVDVGGGVGAIDAKIVERYPHIHAINFDQANVIASAPKFPGVEHVAGDMFQSIPSGCDTVFMKTVLHDWNDSDCLKILQNCYEALPHSGKVILVEAMIPLKSQPSPLDAYCGAVSDITMMTYSTNGKERSEAEWRALLSKAGFSNIKFLKLNFMYVIEATRA